MKAITQLTDYSKQAAPMSPVDKQALALRDLAVTIAKTKGVLISEANAHVLFSYHDARLRIEYTMARRTCSTCTGMAIGIESVERDLG